MAYRGRETVEAGHPSGVTGLDDVRGSGDQAWTSPSEVTFFTRFGSTWMPGPIVVETVIFLM